MDKPSTVIGPARQAEHSCRMKAEYVELVLLEQSLANAGGMTRPFFDRVSDVAEKTDGSILFDVRVDGDMRIQRLAAIGYGANGTVAIIMDKQGQLSSAPIDGDEDKIVELTVWCSLPMAEQARVSYTGAIALLLAKLRQAGFLE
ncbi:hypothetical protein NKH85_33080 [Mesorhizobium sp. M0924]|uniref:hypothetical protein n=1 Tax=unclassified Mesorhizobium TaxID=325217 RepID=UPI0033356ACA